MNDLKQKLEACLRQNDLLRSSLSVGHILDPTFSEEPHVEKIMQISSHIWNTTRKHRKDILFVIESVNHTLFKEMGFLGSHEKYKRVIDNPSECYLHLTLESKKGNSLSITILYWIILEQLGIECECFAFPSHYLLKIEDVVTEYYINPFENGKVISSHDFQKKFKTSLQKNRLVSTNLYEKTNKFQMVVKVIQQLKQAYVLKGDALKALRSVEILTALFPESPELTRDRGILYCEMEYFSKAMADLKFYLDQRPHAEDIKDIKKLTTMLKSYRETIN